MKSRKWTMQIILLALALLMLSVAFFAFKLAYAQEAYVWTDKEDYAPEETVTIYGAGFTPYSTVTVSLTRPDGHINQWNVAADEYGSFTTTYQLDGIAGTYTVTATDGANKATTTFTDRTWFVSVSPASATVSQGGSTTATVTVTASPTGGPEVDLWATGQPSGVTVNFSPTKGVPNFNSTMSINVSLTTTPGTYPINIIVFTGQPGEPSYSEKARTTFTLNVTGIPPATVSITITSSPITGAGFVKVDGVAITTPATFTWTVGSTHTLEALSPVAGPTGTRYVWTSWSDGGAQTHTYIVPSSSEAVTANYVVQYLLTVTSDHGVPSGAGWYDAGDTAYARLDTGNITIDGTRYLFVNWTGDATGTNYAASDAIHMDGPKTAIAEWKTQYYLTVRTDPPGVATIPGEGWYDSLQSVQLTAPTVSGYTFNYWDVDGTSQGSGVTTITVVMNASRTATAHYEKYVPPAQVDLTCQCYVTDGSFRKIGSFTTVFTRVNYATYRLSSTKPNAFYYCIQITNPGATSVSGVVLSFQLDPEFVIVGSDPVQVHTGYGRTGSRVSATVSYNLNSGTVNISSIGAGQTLYVTISMDYKFKGQTFTRSQALNWVANHPSNTFSCTLERPVTHQCSATIKDPVEIELQWTGYVQAATLVGLMLTGFGLAFKLNARRGHGKESFKSLYRIA
jgi:hypothetical protein